MVGTNKHGPDLMEGTLYIRGASQDGPEIHLSKEEE